MVAMMLCCSDILTLNMALGKTSVTMPVILIMSSLLKLVLNLHYVLLFSFSVTTRHFLKCFAMVFFPHGVLSISTIYFGIPGA